MDERDERILGNVGQSGANRLGPRRPTGDTRDDLRRGELLGQQDRGLFPSGRSGNDDRIDPRRTVEPIKALGKQRSTREVGKRLRPINAQPLACTRGDDKRPDVSDEVGNV